MPERRGYGRLGAAALLIALLLGALPAAADCMHNGQRYPEGTRIGVLVCEDGEWVVRPA